MYRIFITADVAKEAKEILEKEFIVDIQPNMEEDELCKVIADYDAIITRSTRPLRQGQNLAWIRTLAAVSAGD